MPIYVYGCEACGAVEEHIQRFSDPPLTKCESCGGRLEKQITSAAFQLKGGGWYKDGYASSKGGGATDKGASSSSDTKTPATPSTTGTSSSGSGTKDAGTKGSGTKGSSSSTAAE